MWPGMLLWMIACFGISCSLVRLPFIPAISLGTYSLTFDPLIHNNNSISRLLNTNGIEYTWVGVSTAFHKDTLQWNYVNPRRSSSRRRTLIWLGHNVAAAWMDTTYTSSSELVASVAVSNLSSADIVHYRQQVGGRYCSVIVPLNEWWSEWGSGPGMESDRFNPNLRCHATVVVEHDRCRWRGSRWG